MLVERSKEFVERLRSQGARGVDCITMFKKAHRIASEINKGQEPITSYHIYDQCQERSIPIDFETMFRDNSWVLKSGHVIKGHYYFNLEKEDLRFVCALDHNGLVLVTAYVIEDAA